MSEESEIKGMIPSYYGFLITGLTQIREYWAKNMYVEALAYALKFTSLLPRKIKKELSEEKLRIEKKLASNHPTNASTLYGFQRATSKTAYRIATQELEPYLDRMTSLLDQNNLLTQQYGVPTRTRSMKDFQMTVDKAQFDAGKEEN